MALDHDGTNDLADHTDIALFSGAAALTIMAWVNPDGLEAGTGYFGQSADTGHTWSLCAGDADSNDVMVDITSTTGRRGVTSQTALVVGTWVHLTFWYDGSQTGDARVRLYVDGVSASLSHSGAGAYPATLANVAASFTTGYALNGGAAAPGYADAKIAHLKGWTVALTAAEIANEMLTQRPQRTANLLLWCPYDDGTTAQDYTGNGYTGTVSGAVQAQGPPVAYGG